ncbi:tetratricopeptide repeat protein [Candidatus Margulisiibacteriota bacterium]
MKKIVILSIFIITMGFCATASAASLEKAALFNKHGLVSEAKKELIGVIFSKASSKDKAEAYYLLGSIAFDERRVSVALDSWKTLVAKYPKSKEAALVKDKIAELAEIVGESAEESIRNVIAQSYLRHADFWSSDKNSIFKIDSSWIPNVESSIKWYDKVLEEFPNSESAEHAYKGKLRTLLGWKEYGKYGESHGVKGDFSKYMPQLLSTFKAFERDYPKAGSLQGFRYQIAQAYWKNANWKKTKEWLNRIIEIAGEKDSFYKDLAERRLKKVEY